MDDSDPYDWSVEQVVNQLCRQHPPLWAHQPHIKTIPGLQILEDALLAHDIDGESLMILNDGDLKDEIGLHSFGQRRAILKVIAYLRSRSRKIETLHTRQSIKRSSEEAVDSEDAIDGYLEPRKRRRIAPILVSDLLPPANDILQDDEKSLPPDLQDLLEKYRQQSDESVYGGSQSSGSDGSSVFEEYADLRRQVEDENQEVHREIIPQRVPMTSEEVDEAIEDACQNISRYWFARLPQRVVKHAFREWNETSVNGNIEVVLQSHQEKYNRLAARMTRFKNKIKEDQYFNSEEVKARCGNLEATVEDISEEQHYMSILSNEFPPTQPSRQVKPRKRIVSGMDEFGSYDIAESESDSEDDTWLEDFVETDASSHTRTLSSEVQSHLSYSISDDCNINLNVQTPPQRETKMPTSEELAQSQLRNPLHMGCLTESDEFNSPYNSDLDQIPRLPLSRYRNRGGTLETAIELNSPSRNQESSGSVDSDSSMLIANSPVAVERQPLRLQTSFPPVNITRHQAWDTIADGDHRLALAKEIYTMNRHREATQLLAFTHDLKQSEVIRVLKEVLEDHHSPAFVGVADSCHGDAVTFAYLFVCYIACYGWDYDFDAIPQSRIDTAIRELEDAAKPFHSYLVALCQWYINPVAPSSSTSFNSTQTPGKKQLQSLAKEETTSNEEISIGDCSDAENPQIQRSARKYRKRFVKQSQEAKDFQKNDLARVEFQEQRRAELMESMQAMNPTGEEVVVPVNTTEPVVYLDQHIAKRAKEHQISGIQFMWRELIEDAKHQGCLLAHTMGLGKTMQVISILVTIAQCNHSPIPDVRELIPQHLRQNKTIILCPASLLDNWRDEILMWMPTDNLLGGIYLLVGNRDQKIKLLRSWAVKGGVAIVSYESFRSLHKNKGLDEEIQSQVQDYLLQAPALVVADEAHKMKNADSSIAKLTKQFKTSSRIALTGSPLNNHLIEYHTMIDWIAQGYLGSMVEFKSTYSEPINYGLYQDSTNYERRKAQRQLYKLKSILAPKIHRADILAVIADMPQKTEFYITVTLTKAQVAAYKLIAEHLLSYYKSSGQPLANAKLWSWISVLSWLCNHPSCLIKKLQERSSSSYSNMNSENASNAPSPVENGDVDGIHDLLPENTTISNDSTIVSLLPEIEQIFQQTRIENGMKDDDPALSHRSLLTYQILEEATRIGDKTLLFSHSIPTLNYLESMMKQMNLKYLRIDGSTDTQRRQEATKLFNQQDSNFSVFLISTRAGGLGLNLQGANRVIIYDFGFNPSWEEQAIGRAYRFGQQRPVYVYRFRTGGTFENAMHNTAVFKTQLFSRVVDYKNVTRHASKAVESYLFVPTDVPMEDFSESLGKDPEVLDKLIKDATDGYIRDIVLTETFQIEDEDDELTPEEVKSAEEELVKERLMKKDPVAYQQLMRAEAQKQAAEAQAVIKAPPFPFNVPVMEPRPMHIPMETRDDINLEKM